MENIKKYGVKFNNKICRASRGTVVISCDTVARKTKNHYVGGGGTDLRAGIALAESCGDAIVVITDGLTPWPESPKKPVICVLVTIDNSVTAPEWIAKTIKIQVAT